MSSALIMNMKSPGKGHVNLQLYGVENSVAKVLLDDIGLFSTLLALRSLYFCARNVTPW